MFVGKWKYCSPEHLGMLAEGERIDGRADIYSFGIVLYEMLTGVPPFQADTPHGFLMLHASEKPRALRDSNPSVTVSPELEALIFRALEKDRSKRFATARDFARALEALIPTLDDRPGAEPILPTAIEVTEEPTQSRPTPSSSAPTVVTESQAETMRTIEVAAPPPPPPPNQARTVRTIGSRDLVRPKNVEQPAQLPSWKRIAAGALIAIALIIGIAYLLRSPSPPKNVVKPVVAQARLGINAFPWGQVTNIRNVASGESVSMKEPIVTPAPVDLAPGTYEITVTNPEFRDPVKKTVELRAGAEQLVNVTFTDPATAKLPRFDGAAE